MMRRGRGSGSDAGTPRPVDHAPLHHPGNKVKGAGAGQGRGRERWARGEEGKVGKGEGGKEGVGGRVGVGKRGKRGRGVREGSDGTGN